MTLVKVERTAGSNTPLLEPQDNIVNCWPQQQLSAVLVHRPNHWVTYRKVARQWFCLDSLRPNTITRANPFTQQNNQTIELLVFKE